MSNTNTLESFSDEQRKRILAVFGQPEIDESLPDGIIRLTEKAKVEHLPKDQFLSRLERLELAKNIREQRLEK